MSGGRTTTYGRLDPNKFSATINTYFNRPNVGTNYHYSQKRLITPREALRIQSFPDNFEPEFAKTTIKAMMIEDGFGTVNFVDMYAWMNKIVADSRT